MRKAVQRVPVIGLPADFGNDQACHLNSLRLKFVSTALAVRDAVITDLRISQNKYLSLIRRIGKCLRITDHASVENDLTFDRCRIAEMSSHEPAVVLEP